MDPFRSGEDPEPRIPDPALTPHPSLTNGRAPLHPIQKFWSPAIETPPAEDTVENFRRFE